MIKLANFIEKGKSFLEKINSLNTSNITNSKPKYCENCGQLLNKDLFCSDCNKPMKLETKSNNYKQFIKEYATTIVLWAYNKPKKLYKNNEVPLYFQSECGIYNINIFLKELIANDYLKNVNKEEIIKLLKVNELKNLLKNNNLPTTGNKSDLITRILSNNIPVPIYKEIDNYYIISSKGNDFYNSHLEYVELHRHQQYQITPKEYYEIKTKINNPNYKFNDYVWNIFQKRNLEYEAEKEYSQLYFNCLNMAQLCDEDNKFNISVNLYLKCLIYELCGVFLQEEIKWCKQKIISKSKVIEYASQTNKINQNNIRGFLNGKDYFNKDEVYLIYNSIPFNWKLCSLKTIEELIIELLENSMIDIEEYNQKIIHEQIVNLKKIL